MNKIIDQKIVNLSGTDYVVFLKEIPTKLGDGGIVEATTIRAFVKRM